MVAKEFLRGDIVMVAWFLPREETRWEWVHHAVVVDERATRKWEMAAGG